MKNTDPLLNVLFFSNEIINNNLMYKMLLYNNIKRMSIYFHLLYIFIILSAIFYNFYTSDTYIDLMKKEFSTNSTSILRRAIIK